uniref:RBR-type E3 ubiquitin transferase n=1 Tax=Ascaris suum TaxID=6253 RepID=F1KRC4_ASCSU
MPQYSDDQIPSARRDRRKDLKIYRNKKQLKGPALISKYVWFEDSHSSYYKFIDNDGSLKKHGSLLPYPSLIAANKILYEGFDVPFSVNKRRRWNTINELSKSLHSLQDPSIGLRVSLLRVEAELQIVRAYDRPEWQLDYTSSYIKLIEFLGFNGDHQLYINRRNATFEDIYRHTRIPNHSWEVRPKIERYRRRRKRQPEILHVQTNEERGRDRDVAFNDRKAHILIKEQSCVTSARRVNMDEKRNRRRAASLEAEERQHRRKKSEKRKGRKKARKHPREQKIGKKAAMSIIPCCADWMIEPVEFIHTGELVSEVRSPMLASTAELVTVRQPHMRRRTKNKHKGCMSEEYARWLHGCCAYYSADEQNIASGSASNAEFVDENATIPTLDSSLIPLGECETFALGVKQLFPHCRPIEGISPSSFFCEVDQSQPIPSASTPDLQEFVGVLILQDARIVDHENAKFIRCIRNERSCSADGNNESDAYAVTNSSISKIMSTTLGCFMPSECVAISSCYEREQSNSVALSYAIERSRSRLIKQKGDNEVAATILPSCSRQGYCGICYDEGGDGFALACGHHFCRECWAHYAYLKIKLGQAPVMCIEYKCDEFLNPEHLLLILPIAVRDQYERLLCNSQLIRSEWIYCARCTRVVHVDSTNEGTVVVVCKCGAAMCTKCGERMHMPLSCADARFYLNAVETNGRNFHIASEERSVMVKQCPECHLFCERIDGCNHMECPCGADFCYVCGKPFFGDRSDHYACSSDVTVRVDLFDVPKVAFNKLSLAMFEECVRLRQAREGHQLHILRKHLTRILHHDYDEVYRILQLYCAACESLELGVLGSHLFRRQMRHVEDNNTLMKATVVSSSISGLLLRLRFFVRDLLRKSQVTSTKRTALIELKLRMESCLREYLLEASKGAKIPVLTTV